MMVGLQGGSVCQIELDGSGTLLVIVELNYVCLLVIVWNVFGNIDGFLSTI